MRDFIELLSAVKSCTICSAHLPLGPRPVLQLNPAAKILIAGQAPGVNVHISGVPFDDASGERLRKWLGISQIEFYDETKIAILPMGFCYPGKGSSGDLPPRPECAPAWREELLSHLPNLQLTVVLGSYALAYHLPGAVGTLTDVVLNWKEHWPEVVPLPHPSPRNNIWLSKNEWFESEVVPVLQQQVASIFRESRISKV